MIKNRTTQLIFQSFYCAIGLIGAVASLGIFDDILNPRWDFYAHFTNLSNYLCIGIMFAELVQTAKKSENSYVSASPLLKFIGLLGIMLTFLVFNFLLAGRPDREFQANWRVSSICLHVILPIMYIFDWLLFYEHKKIRWFYPLVSVAFPALYIIFIYTRAFIVNFNPEVPYLYPYFFLNLDNLGVAGVAKWIAILFAGFIVLGYIFYGIDKLIKSKE
ncbi:MAG: Pr6Pr family membrane protein [Clostridia bacterium]|nr:Pr6Pr family membrane protein [Clostridia bacterium]